MARSSSSRVAPWPSVILTRPLFSPASTYWHRGGAGARNGIRDSEVRATVEGHLHPRDRRSYFDRRAGRKRRSMFNSPCESAYQLAASCGHELEQEQRQRAAETLSDASAQRSPAVDPRAEQDRTMSCSTAGRKPLHLREIAAAGDDSGVAVDRREGFGRRFRCGTRLPWRLFRIAASRQLGTSVKAPARQAGSNR